MTAAPVSIEELRDVIAGDRPLGIVGGGSKSNLSRGAHVSLARLSGIVEYDPCEYTVTVLAGTPLVELQQTLAEKRQFLPFDPPLARRGATIGGTVAAGLSGPGSLRHGTLRDFLLGVRFVTGDGKIIFGGGKVVKNAAGFDFPKLMVGALGELGALAELTFKVFPLPAGVATLQFDFDRRDEAMTAMQKLALSPLEPACLDVLPGEQSAGYRLLVRVGGASAATARRVERVGALLGRRPMEVDDQATWEGAREFNWLPPGQLLVKCGGRAQNLLALVDALAIRVYRLSLAGHVLWFGWPTAQPIERLDEQLAMRGLSALALLGGETPPHLGQRLANPFYERIRQALDPHQRLARNAAHAA